MSALCIKPLCCSTSRGRDTAFFFSMSGRCHLDVIVLFYLRQDVFRLSGRSGAYPGRIADFDPDPEFEESLPLIRPSPTCTRQHHQQQEAERELPKQSARGAVSTSEKQQPVSVRWSCCHPIPTRLAVVWNRRPVLCGRERCYQLHRCSPIPTSKAVSFGVIGRRSDRRGICMSREAHCRCHHEP